MSSERFLADFGAALIDMDGVLYDSMKGHTAAWYRLMTELGVECSRDEFYLYEGMTGKATVNLLFRRAFGHEAGEEEVEGLYARKAAYFRELPEPQMMPGASRMLAALERGGLKRILVTGSAQGSLLDRLDKDYPGVFPATRRITALNVSHGKPHPEPYLKGAALAGVSPQKAIVVENAPLGVRAGKAAGAFTVAVMTGPIPRIEFEREGADAIFPSMEEFAEWLEKMERRPLSSVVYTSEPEIEIEKVCAALAPDRVCTVTDANISDCGYEGPGDTVILSPCGEKVKNAANLVGLWEAFGKNGMTRRSVAVNLGGGTVTDLGGFAAATYKRGIRFINVPTTLLAAADAAVGGKTGIDVAGYKNEAGAFAFPEKVIVSGKYFATLPEREILGGMAEIVKTALISDAGFYGESLDFFRQWRPGGTDARRRELMGEYAARAASFKELTVAIDPIERGQRRILNFGHTAGHAFETLAAGVLNHGEAVAHGIMFALMVSVRIAGLADTVVKEYRDKVLSCYPPLPENVKDPENVIRLMGHDKKNPAAGDIRMVLLAAVGRPLTDIPVPPAILRDELARLFRDA